MAPTRWGIASTGKISSDFTAALQMLPSDHHQVAAVGARALSSAQEFAQKFNIPTSYGSYQELADDSTLDVVYVGTIHPTHYDVCKVMLNAGRSVLCEKPLTMNARQARELVALAKERKVFFMEGFWSRFFPVYQRFREELSEGTIGEVGLVQVNFGSNARHVPRISQRDLGGGATLDLGCYPIQLAVLVYGEAPQKVVASGILTDQGVDESVFVTLHFSNNRVAQLNFSTGVTLSQRALIFGSKGRLEIPNFWNPEQLVTPAKTYNHPLPKSAVQLNYLRSEGFVYEAEAVRQSLLKGETENPLMSHQDSVIIMDIMDEIRRQIGLVYDADKD